MNLADDPLFQELSQRVAEQSSLNLRMALDLEANTKTTGEINTKMDKLAEDTKEVISAFKNVKASFELLETLSRGAKILIPLFMIAGYVGYAGEATWNKVKSWLH